jgi:prevent-host-death family protein
METIGVRELKARASEIVRRVRDQRETIGVTVRGRVVARIVPVERQPPSPEELSAVWASIDEIAAEIGAHWPPDVTAVDAVREGRREL